MRAIILSRLITVLGAAGAIAACEDSMSPSTPAGPTTAGITVIPSTATIHAGQLVTLQARIKDEFGDVLDGVSWKSSDDAIATVGSNGAVVGRMKGTVTVTASALGKAQSAVVHVLERESKDGGKGISKKGVPLLLRRN